MDLVAEDEAVVGTASTASAASLHRSWSLPHVTSASRSKASSRKQPLHFEDSVHNDSGVSLKEGSELCPSLIAECEAGRGGPEDNEVQGDFASGGSGMLASEPQSSVHSEVQVVKQLVLSQIDKKLKDLRTLKQHYYPEGGWGWVILIVTFLVYLLTSGTHWGLAMYMNGVSSSSTPSTQVTLKWPGVTVKKHSRRLLGGAEMDASWLGSLSVCVSLLISPLTIGVCRRKSTRLTAVMGGLVTALGCLFTSFASQFHQLFLSFGIMTGIGVGMTRDPATLMIGQYFKRKREFVEIILVSGSGIGLAIMSVFIQISISSIGWRLGLQAVTGVIFVTFFLGTFYRSASLYHPQRRAILHLKSQKRKIKNKDKEKNKAQDDRPPYFDFATLKSRTVQILLASIAIASLGLNVPIFYLTQQAHLEGLGSGSLLVLQAYLGLAWMTGCWIFGLIVISNSKECRISKQYLCQASLLLCGVAIMAFTAVQGYNGYVLFVWIYGIFVGAYNYTLKMYIYEKVRARNFARAWGFAQFAMAIPNLVGPPLAGYLNQGFGGRSGFYLSAVSVILGSLTMCLIDVHRKNLRRRHRKHKRQMSMKSLGNGSVAVANTTANSMVGGDQASAGLANLVLEVGAAAGMEGVSLTNSLRNENLLQRKPSFSEQDDILPPISLLSHQRSFTYDDLIDFKNMKPENSVFSEEGIADMDLPDHLFMEELEYLDNITSCNKVENCLMLSEYEQNLIKETENPSPGGGYPRRGRKWSLFRQQSGLNPNEPMPEASPGAARPTLGVGGLRQNSFSDHAPGAGRRKVSNNGKEIPTFPNTAAWNSRLNMPGTNGPKRSITVIEEASV